MLTPIAIKVLSPNSMGKRKLKPYEIYYFLEGFEIKDNGYMYIQPYRLEPDILYQDYFSENETPHINISAIVGENGSGKSSLVEFYMRLVNNFAAATIGEYEINPGARHLHYINNIQGEFYYLIDKVPYRLQVQSRNVILEHYSPTGRKNQSGSEEYKCCNTACIFNNMMSREYVENDSEVTPMQHWKLPKRKQEQLEEYILNTIYKHFFYSYISNYSIYAYNTTDFRDECNSNHYETVIRKEKKKMFDHESRNWLNGIFHKNDGYQTPIVLTPFRTKGNIDINTENTLSRERLIVLLIMPKSQFRTINGHLTVSGLKLTQKNTEYNAKYLNRNLGFKRLQQKGFDKFKALILSYWKDTIGIDLQEYADTRIAYEEAVGYLVYKTLKISSKYRQYNSFFGKHSNIAYKIDEKALKDLIKALSIDHSHITKKIRQILAYIIHGTYEFSDTSQFFKINEISNKVEGIIMSQRQINTDNTQEGQFMFSIDDLVPPPIYDVSIELEDNKDKTPILFETLSSGERQQTYSISALLYHLSNLESVWQDSHKQRIAYKHVNVIMEEIELYFHPELQRTYIKNVLDGIKQIRPNHIESINICFVTHSPFVLSDIPSRNILALKIEDEHVNASSKQMSTFGANIHDMLKNSFFLEHGPIGAYADWVIRNIINKMEIASKGNTNVDTSYIHEKIMLIDEPIVRMALLDEYHRVFPDNDTELKIKELQRQIQELKNRK